MQVDRANDGLAIVLMLADSMTAARSDFITIIAESNFWYRQPQRTAGPKLRR
jgi:hypothetical protein